MTIRFVGNVEGKDLVADHADVVVTDAVAGNVPATPPSQGAGGAP